MATLPSLNSNKELKQDVEAWCLEQPEKLTAAEVAKQFPDLKNYNVRSVNKIVGNAFKHAHDLQNAMDRKRTADTMMEVARSGTHLAKSVSAATEGEVHSPPEHRESLFVYSLISFSQSHICSYRSYDGVSQHSPKRRGPLRAVRDPA